MEKIPTGLIQENKMGGKGTQIAEQNNYYGMSYQDVYALCANLFREELKKYKDEAEVIAKQRYEKLLSTLFERLKQEKIDDDKVCEEFKNPDMQYTYVEAQKAYIRLGTQELEMLLADLLVNRIKENKRTLLQIVLGEAITVVPMLLPEQIDILALCFLVRYTRVLAVNSIVTFVDYVKKYLLPFVFEEKPKASLFQHLVYAKTGSIDVVSMFLSNSFSRNYTGLFLKGYEKSELEGYEKNIQVFL